MMKRIISLLGVVAVVIVGWLLLKSPSDKVDVVPSMGERSAPTEAAPSVQRKNAVTTSGRATPDKVKVPVSVDLTLKDNLALSQNPEDRLAAAMLEIDSNKRESLLFSALSQDPSNALLNYLVVEHCLTYPSASACGSYALEDNLKQLDIRNGVVDDLSAIQRYRNGNLEGALDSLKAAGRDKLSDDYRWQKMQALDDAFLRQGEERTAGFVQKVVQLSEATQSRRMPELIHMCQDQRSDPLWQEACVARGVSLSQHSLSVGGKMFGYGLAMASGEQPQQMVDTFGQSLQKETRKLQEMEQVYAHRVRSDADWRLSDEQWQHYLTVYADAGELAALTYLVSINEEG